MIGRLSKGRSYSEVRRCNTPSLGNYCVTKTWRLGHRGVLRRQILLPCRQIKDGTPILSANSF